MRSILTLASILFLSTNLFAARTFPVKLYLVSDTNGDKSPTLTASFFSKMIDYANKVYANHGTETVQFTFNPTTDVIYLNDSLVSNDFELAPGETVDPHPVGYQHKVLVKKYTTRKNHIARLAGKYLVVFVSHGNQIYFDKKTGIYSMGDRSFAYSNFVDQFVMLTSDTTKVSLFAHEVGHYLGLAHTQGASPETQAEFDQVVADAFKAGANLGNIKDYFDGDGPRVRDTAADPGPAFWQLLTGDACGSTDKILAPVMYQGKKYFLEFMPDRQDIMSYFDGCTWPTGHHITADQSKYVYRTYEIGAKQRIWSNANEDTSIAYFYNSEFDVVSWGPDRMDIVVQGADGFVNHMSYSNYAFGIDYGVFKTVLDMPDIPWNRMPLYGSYNPSIGSMDLAKLGIFVVANGALNYQHWNGYNWLVENKTIDSKGYVGKPSTVRVVKGQLSTVVRATNGHMYYFVTPDGANFAPVKDLGGTFISDAATVSWGEGRLDIFAKGSDKRLYHKWFQVGSGWGPAGDIWEDLGGPIQGKPAVTSWGPNRLDIVVRGTNNQVYHKAWTGSSWYPSILGWNSLGGNLTTSPSITSYKFNGLVVGGNFNGQLAFKYWNGTSWFPSLTDWSIEQTGMNPVVPVKVHGLDGNWHIFGRGISGEVVHKSQNEKMTIVNWEIIGRMF